MTSSARFGRAGKSLRPTAKIAVSLLVAYSIVHFAYSGVWRPNIHHGMVQNAQEMRPLQRYFLWGPPVGPDNYRQYGPTFLFVLHPILYWFGGSDPGHLDLMAVTPHPDTVRLSRFLYVVDLASIVLACWFVLASVRLWLAESPHRTASESGSYATFAVILLWMNYSPLFEVLEVKNVEIWELCLVSAATYAHLAGRSFWSGFCIAAAALMKWLPGFFFLLLLLRDRRGFLYACANLVAFLGIAHWVYGPELGFFYPLLPIKAALGQTIGFTLINNISLKELIAKALGTLQVPTGWHPDGPETGYYVTLTPERSELANLFGNVCTVVVTAWMVWAFLGARRRMRSVENDLWAWALAGAVMFVASPIVAYEYSLLVLPAFSIAAAIIIAKLGQPGYTRAAVLCGVALFLVGNIVPRQIVQRIIPLQAIVRWSGYTHLKLTEAYNYFGFPMFGVLLLILVLWWIRPDRSLLRHDEHLLDEKPA